MVEKKVDYERVLRLGRELLEALGEDPDREGLRDTPRRWADWWKEFVMFEPGVVDTTFESFSSGQLVTVSAMRVYSICEHHLLPFWCDVSIGYIVHERVVGLSKFARIAHDVAHHLQVQERITDLVADRVQQLVGSPDVVVLCRGVHTCMVMRGIKTEGTMTSIVKRGVFESNPDKLSEFLTFAKE